MKKYVRILVLIALVLLFSTSCTDALVKTNVRFRNDSATKSVYAVWDGSQMAALAPGAISEYQEVNSGTHTIQWKNAANNKDLTTMAWPNLVQGETYTFPYSD